VVFVAEKALCLQQIFLKANIKKNKRAAGFIPAALALV